MQCGNFACFDLNLRGKFVYRIICPSVAKGTNELSGFFKLQEKLKNRLESERIKQEYAKEHGVYVCIVESVFGGQVKARKDKTRHIITRPDQTKAREDQTRLD
jgi:hypothetical protein